MIAPMCKLLLLLLLLSAMTVCVSAQEPLDTLGDILPTAQPDTALSMRRGLVPRVINYFRNSNKETTKPFDCSVSLGPFYNSKSSFSVGGGISALYKWDRNDPELRSSVMSIMGMISVRGMFAVDVSGLNYMKKDRSRWSYKLKFSTDPMNFWGIGYDHGADNRYKCSYKQIMLHFKPDYLFRLAKNFYLGPSVNLSYTHTYDFSHRELIGGQNYNIFSNGIGGVLQYDSRDYSTNAYRGHYLRIEQLFYPKLTNTYYFNSTDITYSTYHPLWSTAVFAFEYHSLFDYGEEIPWTMLALVAADNNRMRGYYEGRYRDRNIVEAQVEIRQRLPRRFGIVVFAGAANVFHDFKSVHPRQTLPNYGVGGRWEFKKRVNIRLDLGFTKNKPGVVFNINEAF